MNERKIRGIVIAICLMALVGVTACMAEADRATLTDEQRQLNVESFDYIWTTIRDKYYDPDLQGVDWNGVREELRPQVEQALTMDEARTAMDELVNSFDQSHFNLIPDEVYEALGRPDGAIDGTSGITARVLEGRALVTRVEEGSPGAKAGVRPGWQIIKMDGEELEPKLDAIREDFEGKSWKETVLSSAVTARLLGPVGGKLSITFLDGDDQTVETEIDLVQGRGVKSQFFNLPAMHVWAEYEKIDGNIGYIAFNMWLDPANVMPVIDEAMTKFIDAEVEGIVIDVRGNGGGLPGMAMGVAGWLVEEKNKYLGTVITRDTSIKIVVNPRPSVYSGPVVVLVDEMSGSCSEMFSGGMQDIDRARIIGRRTAGAALPSAIERLPNNDGFQYAFANYKSAGGEMLEGVGVVPDATVAPSREALLDGNDPALEEAVTWIRSQ